MPPAPRARAFELGKAPGHLLRRCHQRSHDIYAEVMGPDTVTRQQTAVLIAVLQNPGASQQDLADITGCDRNTLAEVFRRLERAGLALRQPSARDGRAYEISITRKGAEVVEALLPALEEVQRRILEPLPPEMRAPFLACLRAMSGLEMPHDQD
jgi:DNA-binding MarR family transcriptional regulator